MKKLIGIILTLAMMMCMVTAFAGQPGDQVTVTMQFSSSGACAVTLNVNYDHSVLSCVSSSSTVGYAGPDRISMASLSAISSATFTYVFKISDDAAAGTYPVTLIAETCADANKNPVDCTLTNASVTVTRPNCQHEKTTIHPEKAVTCTENGMTEGETCDLCHKVLVEQTEIIASGHKRAVLKGYAPTCTKVGVTDAIRCENCGDILEEPTLLRPTGHLVSMEETVFAGMEGNEAVVRFVFSCCDGKKAVINWTYDEEMTGAEYLRNDFSDEEPGVLLAVFQLNEAGIFTLTGAVESSATPDATYPCTIIAHSEVLMELPEDLTNIKDAAFVNTSAVEYVLPAGLKTIGSRAFADNEELILVNLPDGLTTIAADAFSGCSNVTILCTEDSIGHQYAEAQKIPYILVAE